MNIKNFCRYYSFTIFAFILAMYCLFSMGTAQYMCDECSSKGTWTNTSNVVYNPFTLKCGDSFSQTYLWNCDTTYKHTKTKRAIDWSNGIYD